MEVDPMNYHSGVSFSMIATCESNMNILLSKFNNQTRGPRGPWVAHLRKRSKATMEPIIENPRGII